MEDKAMTPDEFKAFLNSIGGADIDTSGIPDAPQPSPPEPSVGEDHGPGCSIENGTYTKARDRQLVIAVPLHHFVAILMGFQQFCMEQSIRYTAMGVEFPHFNEIRDAFDYSNSVFYVVQDMVRESDGDEKQTA